MGNAAKRVFVLLALPLQGALGAGSLAGGRGSRASVEARRSPRLLAFLLAATAMLAAAATVGAGPARPNILFILADNLSYGELDVYGAARPAGPRSRASTGWRARGCVSRT
jgi:hypothetical protein